MYAAYDSKSPNGTSRRQPGDRVIYVFRLYRKLNATALGDAQTAGSFLAPVRQFLTKASNFIRKNALAPLQSDATQQRFLEHEYRMPLIVERFDRLPEIRSQFAYTQDGYFIDTARNGKGVTRFSLSGRSFWAPVTVNGVVVDGDAAIKEFSELIDDYLYPPNKQLTSDYQLYWLDITAPVSAQDPIGEYEWLIHPARTGVRTMKDARRPWTFGWQFEFLGLRSNRDLAKAEDGLWSFLISKTFLGQLVSDLGLEGVVATVKDVFGTIDDAKVLVDDVSNVVVAVTDYVNAGGQVLQLGIAKMRGLVASVTELRGRIETAIDTARNLPDRVGDDFGRLSRDFPGIAHNGESSGIAAVDSLRTVNDFLYAVTAHVAIAAASQGESTSVAIGPDASLEHLAFQAQVPPEDLIALNSLQYPFVVGTDRPATGALPNVKYAGESVRVPVKQRQTPAASLIPISALLAANVEALTGVAPTEEDRLFGLDFLIDELGNLVWDAEARDLVLDRGVEHMANVQDRYVRLPLGTVRYAPGLGNYAFENLGEWQTVGRNELLRATLHRTLQQDPRVDHIRITRATTYGGTVSLEHDVVLINGATVPSVEVSL